METQRETEERSELIVPINELIPANTSRIQVRLDEDSGDRQILIALEDTCKEVSKNIATGMRMRLLVGKILVAVRARKIYKQEPWGTFEVFLQKEVIERHQISRATVWEMISVAEYLPRVTTRQAEKVGSVNLALVARAMKAVPEEKREKLGPKLMSHAENMSTEKFRAHVERKHLIQPTRHFGLVTLTFQVTQEIADQWRNLAKDRNYGEAFAELVAESSMSRKRQRAMAA